jgi:phosphate transport system permease protein
MRIPRRFTEGAAGRTRRERVVRGVAQAGAWAFALLLAWPLFDLLQRAGGGLGWTVFAAPDSVSATAAGLRGALRASILAAVPVVFLAIPLGLAVAIYLEELSRGRLAARVVGRSILQLAMLPPVVFGLLGFGGLVVVLGLPVGTPLLAGGVLGLAMLPRITLAAQIVLRNVPSAVRDAGYSMGASSLQVVAGQVLPRAAPGMLGASCTVLARALGEAAPLLMVGFVAFAAGLPRRLGDPGVPLPVLVFRWAESPDPLFASKAAVAGLSLLVVVMLLGLAGCLLERRGASG